MKRNWTAVASSGPVHADRTAEEAAHALRARLEDNFVSNNLPAAELKRMLTDAADAGLPGFRHVGNKAKKWSFKNVHRNLLKHCLRDSAWPPLFYSPLDVIDRKTGKITSRPHPFLLPHEVVCALWKQNGQLDSLRPTEEKHPHFFAHVQKTAQSTGMPADQCIVFGLHGDGVPFGTQGDSVENLTFNFPACDQKWVRILFTTIPKRWAAKGKSMAGALHVLAWSLLHLALGVHPSKQPNGQPFKEKFRRKLAGTPLPCRGLLAEVRADWQWLKQCLHIPAWNESRGICFLCKASLENYKDLSDTAPWRSQPLSPAAFHHAAALQGAPVCPLFHLPGCDVSIISLDWLHNCDSGVCADLAGNALLEVVDSYGQGNRKERCAAVWQLLQDLYRQHNVKDRMDELTPELFLQPKKAPKLRCKAAVTRALAPLLPQLLQLAWPSPSPRQRVVLAAATSMAECYGVLNNWDHGRLEHHSRRCAKLLVSLEAESQLLFPGTRKWRIKPKLHFWMELCTRMARSKGNPRDYWVYADESLGGVLRNIGELRGGQNSAKRIAENLLHRFQRKFKLPLL
jgi:hypothetical protein